MVSRIKIIGNKLMGKTAHQMTQIQACSECTYLRKSSGKKLTQIFIF